MVVSSLERQASEFLLKGIAPATLRTYSSAQGIFLAFCQRLNLNPIPATEDTLILFVTEMAQTRAHSTIKTYISGVCHNPLKDKLWLNLVLTGIQRTHPHHLSPRLPITPLLLWALKKGLQPLTEQNNAMLWAASCLAFFAFLRTAEFCSPSTAQEDESVALSLQDLAVDNHSNPKAIAVTIKKSKTDPFGRGITIYLSKTDSDLCPVSAVLNYIAIRPLTEGTLFITSDLKPLTKQTFVRKIQQSLEKVGIDSTFYKGHSFRIGAATTAAAHGFNDSLIKSLGRWSSDAFQTYLKIPRQDLAKVTNILAS